MRKIPNFLKKRGFKKKKEVDYFRKPQKKICIFCKEGAKIDYKDVNLLKKFFSEKGKIRARRVTGNCAQHQRKLSIAIKRARGMALIPYGAKQRPF